VTCITGWRSWTDDPNAPAPASDTRETTNPTSRDQTRNSTPRLFSGADKPKASGPTAGGHCPKPFAIPLPPERETTNPTSRDQTSNSAPRLFSGADKPKGLAPPQVAGADGQIDTELLDG